MEFSKRKIITNTWDVMKNHLGLWIFIMFLIIALNLLLSNIQEALLGSITSQSILFIIAAYLFQMGLNLGMIRIALNIFNTNHATIKDLIGSFYMLIPYVFATMIFLSAVFLAAAPGIILLFFFILQDGTSIATIGQMNNGSMFIPILIILVPAAYVAIRLQYYDYFLIDSECGVLASITNSAKITKGYVRELFLLGATLSIIFLISIIPLGVGLIISIPLGIMVNTYVYQKLKKQSLKTN